MNLKKPLDVEQACDVFANSILLAIGALSAVDNSLVQGIGQSLYDSRAVGAALLELRRLHPDEFAALVEKHSAPEPFEYASPCHTPAPVGPDDPIPLRDALLGDPRVMETPRHRGGRFLAQAMRGAGMREHVDACHPPQNAETLAVRFAEPGDREAWLFGYRFRDAVKPSGAT